MKPPDVAYAPSPDGKIAYQVVGEGPDLSFFTNGGWNLDLIWDYPPLARFLERLASFARLILFNPRGYSLSDALPRGATLEEWTLDFRWVLDAAGCDQTTHVAAGETGPSAMLFAAAAPERLRGLVLIDTFATLAQRPDYPAGVPADVLDATEPLILEQWGTGRLATIMAPELAHDERFVTWLARLERGTISPAVQSMIRRLMRAVDIRAVLPHIRTPTLVVAHQENPYIDVGHGRYLADHIPNARFVERPGYWMLPWVQDAEWLLSELEVLVRVEDGPPGGPSAGDRALHRCRGFDAEGGRAR